MITISTDLVCVILTITILWVLHKLCKIVIIPKMINKATKEIEKNPKWITNELRSRYYGFIDIDFVLAENSLGNLPRFRVPKDNTRLELLVPSDISTKDVNQIGQIALAGKLKIKYGLFFPDKPIHWLSILLYMLDGGDIGVTDIEKRQETN